MSQNILGATQSELSAAWGELGATLGSDFDWFQPTGAFQPTSDAVLQGTFSCYFDRDPEFKAKKSREYGKPEYYVAYDRDGPEVGAYLKSSDTGETYFLIDQSDLTPSKVVRCNRVVSFYRPGANATTTNVLIVDPTPQAGAGPLTGVARNEAERPNQEQGDLIASGWPVSILQGPKGERSPLLIPEDPRRPWFVMLAPFIPGLVLRSGDRLQDDLGNKYMISSPEADLGYRFTIEMEEA